MVEVGPATENDMVLEFVKAEIASHRFKHLYFDYLAEIGYGRGLIDDADLADARQNLARKKLLALVRGYGNDELLFMGFPADVRWRHVLLERRDFDSMRYSNYPTWTALSEGTRLVSVGAQKLCKRLLEQNGNHPEQEPARLFSQTQTDAGLADFACMIIEFQGPQNVLEIARALRQGTVFPELIAAEGSDGSLTIIEGHARATAYLVAGFPANPRVILGSSPSIREWLFY
jgi:hypothetical protein